MSNELLEFVLAIDEYKRVNKRPFPSWSEVFEVIRYLGYRQVAPKGDHIDHPASSRPRWRARNLASAARNDCFPDAVETI